MVHIEHDDALDWLKGLPDEHASACFCDPPYGLSFMGKQWDHGVPPVDVWREAWRVLKPGGLLLAFGGTRTWHRLAVNIEDAGFDLFDTFMWLYGQGFPKSYNIGKATATPDAETWDGYGTALKPAWEPCLLFRKPRRGTYAQTAIEHGTGALWVDGARVGTEQTVTNEKHEMYGTGSRAKDQQQGFRPRNYDNRHQSEKINPPGRWPANLGLVHHEACDGDCHPDCPARMLGEQSGVLTSGARNGANPNATMALADAYAGGWKQTGGPCEASTGTAARFFYQAKAPRSEREAGLVGMDRKTMGVFGDGEWGKRERGNVAPARNHHPTVKPLAVCEYMARLILPPVAYRDDAVLLVPYAGSASEMIGAWQAGWRNIAGCELEPEYIEIARRRIDHWCRQGTLL